MGIYSRSNYQAISRYGGRAHSSLVISLIFLLFASDSTLAAFNPAISLFLDEQGNHCKFGSDDRDMYVRVTEAQLSWMGAVASPAVVGLTYLVGGWMVWGAANMGAGFPLAGADEDKAGGGGAELLGW